MNDMSLPPPPPPPPPPEEQETPHSLGSGLPISFKERITIPASETIWIEGFTELAQAISEKVRV